MFFLIAQGKACHTHIVLQLVHDTLYVSSCSLSVVPEVWRLTWSGRCWTRSSRPNCHLVVACFYRIGLSVACRTSVLAQNNQLRLRHWRLGPSEELMDVDEAVKGLKAATAYLDRTRGLLSNDNFKDVAGRLLEEVSAGSWPEDMKQELLQAVAKRGGEGSKEPLPMRQRQNMKIFGAYMTTSDMDQLRQGTGALSKLDVLASRMYKIGLHLPSEPTSGHVLSLLAYPGSCCALFFSLSWLC